VVPERMEKTSWTGSVRKEEVLCRVKKKKSNILHTTTRRKLDSIDNMLLREGLEKEYK
jgi:hypothetical protein